MLVHEGKSPVKTIYWTSSAVLSRLLGFSVNFLTSDIIPTLVNKTLCMSLSVPK